MTLDNNTRWNAQYYAKHSSRQYSDAKNFLRHYPFKGDEVILDVGCGDGKLTSWLAQQVPYGKVVGLDCCSTMINFAQHHFPDNRYPNLNFVQEDIVKFNSVERFDLVVSFSTLHWVKDQLEALYSIKKCLKSTGRALLMLYKKCDLQSQAINNVITSSHWRDYFHNFEDSFYGYTPSAYKTFLLKAGFDMVSVELTQPEYIRYKDANALINFMKGWLPQLKYVPERKQAKFMDEVVSAYQKLIRVDMDGTIHVPFSRLEVVAHANEK